MTSSDGVVEVHGKPVVDDAHFVDVGVDWSGITGFRLEALGPGKGTRGLFRLAELGVAVVHPKRPGRLGPVLLLNASGAAKRPKHPVYHAIDNNTRSAWHGLKNHGTAYFECASPISLKSGERLRFTFEYTGCGRDTLGRFRLSATDDPQPLREVGHPLADGWPATQERIDAAIDRSVRRLLEQQERDGSWKQHQDRYPAGQTALSLYTLLKCGVPGYEESIRRAVAFLRAHPAERTYSVAVMIMALCALDPEEHREEISRGVEQLLSWQRRGFGYPEGHVDLSNTQYGALALRDAEAKGFEVPRDAWEDLIKQTIRHQERAPSGVSGAETFPLGFSYRPNGRPTGSMTAAGVTVLAICRQQLPRPSGESKAAMDRGLAWLAKNFSPTCNAVEREPFENHEWTGRLHYYLYGVERVGGLLDHDQIGPHDWYRKGALHLLDSQQDNGGFGGQQASTCFGALFLVRATRPIGRGPITGQVTQNVGESWGVDKPGAPVSIRAGGSAPLTFWVSSYGTATLKSHGWPGEKQRGPHVSEVKYFIARPGSPNKKRLVATVKGDRREPADGRTFPGQHLFKEYGKWVLTAEVKVAKPAEKSAPAVLKAPPVEILARDPEQQMRHGELYGYALDPLNNLLVDADVDASASSNRGSWEPILAADNLHARGWMSEEKDDAPWLLLKLGKPVRANTVLISACHDFTTSRTPTTAPFRRVRLEINGKAREVEMLSDPRRKTVVELPKPLRVRTLKISILDAKRDKLGFAEIELQLRKSGR